MYIPKRYQLDDRDRISQWLTQYPFGTLVTMQDSRPTAVHIPFEWREENGRLWLEGHVARGNPIWRAAPQADEVLAMFLGPHSYISSSWYHDPNVPTWNYVAIHVYGRCRVMADDELRRAMERLLNRYEGPRPAGRTWERLAPELRDREMRGIVGVSIEVTRIEAAQKMSQNRTDGDFVQIVERLESSPDAQDHRVADVMKEVRPELFHGE